MFLVYYETSDIIDIEIHRLKIACFTGEVIVLTRAFSELSYEPSIETGNLQCTLKHLASPS